MKILILIVFIAFGCLADDSVKAQKAIVEAALSYPEVKAIKKSIETRVYRVVDKQVVGNTASIAKTIIDRELTTEKLKNFRIKLDRNIEIRPVIQHNWGNQESSIKVYYKQEF